METTGEVVKTTTGSDGGVTVVRSNAPSDFHMAPRSETSNTPPNSVAPPPPPPPQNSFTPSAAMDGFSSGPIKKRRGRPRKYGHDGAAVTLSPNPISSAAPTTSHVIDFSTTSEKRGKMKPATPTPSSFIRPKYQVENLGEWSPSSAAANFTPHIITVNAGEDVTKRIISFSQQGSLAICVLCANGVVSSVTLRQPDSSGGTLTYEGRFEILSLSGTFMPSDSDGTRSRTGGMSVSLASPDGRVVGGGVAGLLVAATPIQVVVGTFLGGTNQQEQTPKPHNHNFMSSPLMPTSSNVADHRTIRPMTSSLPISTWTPSFPSDSRHKHSHDFNITLT
ncbi:AT-hook motif nuclear-localized protein 2 [Arabidopsis thaliana]|uniref:AT-hook motif nuclear-localized protein 2 n=4 Tax=Arabidopsis TaxID=3701 RepID=AHL2_ARATH|nr:AT hook motif DNA-binding family protein [Arabidopsis thaliana]NP_194008.1 AT hook motif DNA-binding family protein [Arabidopsis thaliana]O49658.1 RecName: Full=AT-hook motif nuclear-localized protein 2 [Arabidopsis thaliana]KAG7616969.1 PPC domain [Arabidopsis thaliana x Arabidopsis arenosa]KAG7621444.1 PPC domain [Arabidopsis suecica]AAM61456.1 putative DNA binding protein [Arabidopsis thaliana]ABH04557.1 At4g22770 [Arabidopsis thaliana]AEE84656.1 AT hook motif DNA-binding family protei|eukprot:NP_001328181.1 AT hook motif DNA-binding family protein [Arabidopsis thaliana]